ncbi:importin subunit alpha-9 isoform X2 [Wolffia australiana]
MAEEAPSHRREPVKSSAHDLAGRRRREHAVTLGKERREALVRAKRICRYGFDDDPTSQEVGMMVDEEAAALDAQTSLTVDELKLVVSNPAKGSTRKKIEVLRELRRLLSKSEFPPIEAAVEAGAVDVLVPCLSFGSPDEQLLEAAWCLTNIAAGGPEQTRSLLPALPLLIAHLGEKSLVPVAEQCAWALGNVCGEGDDLRDILFSQGALLPLARMLMSDKGSTARTAAWALSNFIKGPSHKVATELVRVDGVVDAISRHLKTVDDDLATEVAWVIVYLTALSPVATSLLAKTNVVHLLVKKLQESESLQLLIPVLRSLGNLVAGENYTTNSVLVPGRDITVQFLSALVKCLRTEHRVLKKEAAWVLSNTAAGSMAHKQLIFSSEAAPLLIHLLLNSPFDLKKEAAYMLGNLCVAPEGLQGSIIRPHLAALVDHGCVPGFISLVRSPDIEAARLGLQFLEMVMRGLPNMEGPKIVEREDGIDAMERFQFHENDELRLMANALVDKYFGEDYA